MTQKQLFSKLVSGTTQVADAANNSLAAALTQSTSGAFTFTYNNEDHEWSVTGQTPVGGGVIYYKTSDNQSIDFTGNYEYIKANLGTGITINPLSKTQEFNTSTNTWKATFENEVTLLGVDINNPTTCGPLFLRLDSTSTGITVLPLTSVIIPNTVSDIDMSFMGISGLTSFTIPHSVTNLGTYAIQSCPTLSAITYNGIVSEWVNDVTKQTNWVGSTPLHTVHCNDGDVYVDCTSIQYTSSDGNIVTPTKTNAFVSPIINNSYTAGVGTYTVGTKNVTTITESAFDGQTTLASLAIPNTVHTIGVNAFRLCTSLQSVTIPSSVTSINDYAFHYCTGLTSFNLPNTVNNVGVGILYDCTGLTQPVYNSNIFVTLPKSTTGSYTVPNSIAKIAGGAFQWHTGLTAITLPMAISYIGKEAFDNCNGLVSLTVENSSAPYLDNNAITGLPANCNIYVPDGAVDTYKGAPGWSDRADHIFAIE